MRKINPTTNNNYSLIREVFTLQLTCNYYWMQIRRLNRSGSSKYFSSNCSLAHRTYSSISISVSIYLCPELSQRCRVDPKPVLRKSVLATLTPWGTDNRNRPMRRSTSNLKVFYSQIIETRANLRKMLKVTSPILAVKITIKELNHMYK